jgi:hypothetical protein
MIHPRCPTYVAATSQRRGTAAALCDRSNNRAQCRPSAPQSHLCAAAVKTCGHLGRPIMRYLRTLSGITSACSLVITRRSLLTSAHRELSVAFAQSQGYVYRSCSPRLRVGQCCLGRTLLSLIERSAVRTMPVCWLSVVVVALGSLRALSILADHCVSCSHPC